MKKLVVTLNIGDYLPELTKITFKFMKAYSDKIGAEFIILDQRKLTRDGDDKPLNYEKFQLHELTNHYDWTYFLDSDAFIHPDCPDWAEMVNDKSVVLFSGVDCRTTRFRGTNSSRRSSCQVGACTWNVVCSNWTGPDLWMPPEDFNAAVQNIYPIWIEAKSGHCTAAHLIDDYQLSENIARFGLKVDTQKAICERAALHFTGYEHLYNVDPYIKLQAIRRRLDEMGISY